MTMPSIKRIFRLNGPAPYVWLAAIGLLVYLPSLWFGFTYLDDNVLILDNQSFLTDPANIIGAFRQEVFHAAHSAAAYFRPILTVSFMFDSWVSGASPFAYHASNVLIHLLAAILVFVFLKALGIRRGLAFCAAAVFAVHPVLAQAVSWIPGRNDSLLLLFALPFFITLIRYMKGRDEASPAVSDKLSLPLHFLFFFLAVFTKESALALVPLAVFYLLVILRTKPLNPAPLKLAIGWLSIIILWLLLRQNALVNPISLSAGDALRAIASNSAAVIQYIGKIFIPANLSVLPIMQDTTFGYGIISLALIVPLVGYGLYTQKGYWRHCLFGLLWFLGFTLPSLIRPNTSITADFIEHRMYVPIVGLFVILLTHDFWQTVKIRGKTFLAIFGVILLSLGIITAKYQQNFKDRLSFWENAAQNSPHSPLAHRNLGAMYYLDHRYADALEQYRLSSALNPQEPMVHNNVGLILMNQGDRKGATKEFLEELRINPFYDNAMFNLGLAYYQLNDGNAAVRWWEDTIRINPGYLDAYRNLIAYYQETGDTAHGNYYSNMLRQVMRK